MDWSGISRHWAAAIVVSLGIIASLSLFDHARKGAEDRMSAEFSVQVEARARELQQVLSRYEGTIEGFAAAFPYQHIDAERFRIYAKNVFLASSILQASFESLAWAPHVLDKDRAAFEAAATLESGTPFSMRDKSGPHSLTTAAAKPDYYPLRYIEPKPVVSSFGLDVPRSEAMEKALATGATTATLPIHMTNGGDASLLFVPVYPSTVPSGGNIAPVGLLAFRLSISAAIDAIVAAFEPVPNGVELDVIDDAAPRGERLIYQRSSLGGEARLTPSDETKALVDPYWGSSFTFAGRDCTMILRASPALLAERLAGAGWFELGSGLLLTTMLTLYLVTSRVRSDRQRQLNEKLRREIAVREATEDDLHLMQAAMDHASEAICLVDPAGRYVNVNDATCRQLGYSREELLTMTVFDIAVQTNRHSWQQRWQKYRDVGSLSFEGHRATKGGKTIPVDITVSLIRFSENEYLFIVARDATQRHNIEHQLRTARDLAESASQAKSQFLANMSHELRTPLNAIIGFSEVIGAALFGPLDARYRDYAQDINGSGHHLLRIINDLLDLSKVEAGHLELHDTPIALSAIFETCRRMVCDRAVTGGVVLDIRPTDLEVCADELRLDQILLNLVSNAVKFTPSGGTVVVSASLALSGETVISVADTGIGMAAEDIPRALQPFGQVDNSLSRPHGGTGLGLPLAQRLVELHGGSMSLESEPGKGTTVIVVLPAERTHFRSAPLPAGMIGLVAG